MDQDQLTAIMVSNLLSIKVSTAYAAGPVVKSTPTLEDIRLAVIIADQILKVVRG